MPKFRIYYTITKGGYELIEAYNLQEAIDKWTMNEEVDDGYIEYDPYTEEYYDYTEQEK